MKHKFKKGDKVIYVGDRTGVLSDNLLELGDGGGVNQVALEDAIWNYKPFTVGAWEKGYTGEGGYTLKMGSKFIYGLHNESDLMLYSSHLVELLKAASRK